MVNFVSMLCPELQKLLKPMYDLTRKGRPFLWEKEQQDAFEEIKSRMQKPPVPLCPIEKADSHYIQTTVSLQQAACFINSKMENTGLLHMRAKGCLKQPKTTQSQN